MNNKFKTAKKKFNDLNDAVMAGYSIEEFAQTAVEMEPSEEDKLKLARKGLYWLREKVEDTLSADAEQKVETFMSCLDLLDSMALSWMEFEHDMYKDLLKVRAIRGMPKHVDNVERNIKAKIREIKKRNRTRAVLDKQKGTIWNDAPQQKVLDMLDRKTIRMGDELIDGEPKRTKLNCEIIFRNDTRWTGRIQYCELSADVHLDRKPINEIDEMRAASWIAKVYGFEMEDRIIGKIMAMIAWEDENRYHPVRDWLDGLQWDGHHRLFDVARFIYDSPDANPVNIVYKSNGEPVDYSEIVPPAKRDSVKKNGLSIPHIYMFKTFIKAVARAFEPGCKVDTSIGLISTKQGQNKSMSIEAIATNSKWHSASSFDLKGNYKDAMAFLRGKWIIEVQEAESFEQVSYAKAKTFQSTAIDRYRPMYGRHVIDVMRSCTLWLTTNKEQLGFLNDPSGSRRYWMMRIGDINYHQLLEDDYVRQLWAEAVYWYLNAHNWWLTDYEERARENLNNQYKKIDTWVERMDYWCKDRLISIILKYNGKPYTGPTIDGVIEEGDKINLCIPMEDSNMTRLNQELLWGIPQIEQELIFSLSSVLAEALHIPFERQSGRDIRRASDCLIAMGFEQNARKRIGGIKVRMWEPSEYYVTQCWFTHQING